MEKKPTPVEWLHNRLQTEPFLTNEDFEKAKKMEVQSAQSNDAEMVEFAEWLRMDGFMAVSGSDFWYHKSIRMDSKKYTTQELLEQFKTRNK